MAILTKGSRPHDSIPTSSMADVAFLLLVFFLVTTVFPKDKGLALVLPTTQQPVPATKVLHFLIMTDGQVEVRRGENPQGVLVPSTEIARIWREAVADNADLIAAVKTSREAPYRFMIDVLDQLKEAGAERISLQVLEN